MIDFSFCDTIIGMVGVIGNDDYIVEISIGSSPKISSSTEQKGSLVIIEAIKQIEAYFAGHLKKFDLPLQLNGTPFMKKVWRALQNIPYGTTVSYKEIAIAVGSPKACRAVGLANKRNNIPLVIPCHRVINSGGTLGGFSCGYDKKRLLIELERSFL